jgi:hypothetical protein
MTGVADRLEWLETDGAGGFASGTRTGIRTRRYHTMIHMFEGKRSIVVATGWKDTPGKIVALSLVS